MRQYRELARTVSTVNDSQPAGLQVDPAGWPRSRSIQTMITIDAENVPKIREWLSTRGGVRRWSNQEIASGHAREVFTPADAESAGWRYISVDVTTDPAQILVRTSEVLATFRGRFKAYYFGPGVAPASERKADRMVQKYNDPAVVWTWIYDDPGYVKISIVRESLQPLDLQPAAVTVEP